mmetsp:Transcript_1208/g.3091  ORF Transcript_1208/g.3091 Transcript_1208/m.3091 type:complete len:248 (-) Transcript_1208:476-1219(-)
MFLCRTISSPPLVPLGAPRSESSTLSCSSSGSRRTSTCTPPSTFGVPSPALVRWLQIASSPGPIGPLPGPASSCSPRAARASLEGGLLPPVPGRPPALLPGRDPAGAGEAAAGATWGGTRGGGATCPCLLDEGRSRECEVPPRVTPPRVAGAVEGRRYSSKVPAKAGEKVNLQYPPPVQTKAPVGPKSSRRGDPLMHASPAYRKMSLRAVATSSRLCPEAEAMAIMLSSRTGTLPEIREGPRVKRRL